MTEEWKEVKILTILGKPPGRFLLTIPKREIAQTLGIKGGEKVKVYVDSEKRRIMYELLE